MDFLSGYKTYFAAAGLVLIAIGGFFAGELDFQAMITQIVAAFGLAGLRMGVSKGG